ncbi:MAG TPA: DNA translocase FtsK [Bellilinea sp.]|jgi:S-DNA-T family DNA segregation ATPase FtsK/SpoIIIE|nr:DNA translocase FtsK [Bellilinea sp.]
MSPAASKNSPNSASVPDQASSEDQSPAWWGHLGSFLLRFERFSTDLAGVLLLAFSLITLLALAGLTAGSFISPWGDLLLSAFGWGSYALILLVSALGVWLLRKKHVENAQLHLPQILALEGLIFSAMTFLSILGGDSLERARAGLDGGVVGWGLAHLVSLILPLPWSSIVVLLLAVYFILEGSGIFRYMVSLAEQWAAEAPPEVSPTPVEAVPAAAESSPAVESGVPVPIIRAKRDMKLPPLTLLLPEEKKDPDEDRIVAIARKIEATLAEFAIPARVIGYRIGPTVTQFAVEPGFVEKAGPDGQPMRQKVRVSQISNLSRDLTLALAVERLRIEAPVPGHSYVGIEVPNTNTAMVRLRPLLETPEFLKIGTPLAVALGRDVSGQPVVADLARMPHMLVAGTTGSGKSVCLAALITCLVMNNSPDQLRLAILDPKKVELIRFSGLPHILGQVETELDRMLAVLRWALAEMDARYRVLESASARDLETYNRKLIKRGQAPLPRIVIFVDELADLMMSAPEQTEHSIVRLAQMARAVGIHMVVATQRPSTDVVTGLIKANFPARMAFTVASSIDSRVILDVNGAETLLGRGDMLFLNPEQGTPQRSQGVYLKDQEVDQVIGFWQKELAERGPEAAPWEEMIERESNDEDDLVDQAIELVKKSRKASASLLQRRLRIGYPRAARLLDELEERGVVGPAVSGGKDREVLLDADDEMDGYDD